MALPFHSAPQMREIFLVGIIELGAQASRTFSSDAAHRARRKQWGGCSLPQPGAWGATGAFVRRRGRRGHDIWASSCARWTPSSRSTLTTLPAAW